jgi:hypothetical protein
VRRAPATTIHRKLAIRAEACASAGDAPGFTGIHALPPPGLGREQLRWRSVVHYRLFVIQSALTSECRAPLCSSERQR